MISKKNKPFYKFITFFKITFTMYKKLKVYNDKPKIILNRIINTKFNIIIISKFIFRPFKKFFS